MRTRLCELIGIEFPLLNAPMGGGDAPGRLAAAVSAAGGLGMIGGTTGGGEGWLVDQIRVARERTDRPFGVGFVSHSPDTADLMDVALREGVRVISHSFADPTPFVRAAHDCGALVLCQVRTVEDAERAADAGVDVVTAQGTEAGGHTGLLSTMPLVPTVVDAIAPLPVIAAGGIADGRGIAAALMLGAEGVWLGTRFLATQECGASDAYKARVIAATGNDTVLTDVFDIAAGMRPPTASQAERSATVSSNDGNIDKTSSAHGRPNSALPTADRPRSRSRGEGGLGRRSDHVRHTRRVSDRRGTRTHREHRKRPADTTTLSGTKRVREPHPRIAVCSTSFGKRTTSPFRKNGGPQALQARPHTVAFLDGIIETIGRWAAAPAECRRDDGVRSGPRFASRHVPEAEQLDRLLAHWILLRLAGDGHREFIGDVYVTRDLEVRDPAPTEVSDVLLRQRCAVTDPDPRHDFFAQASVGYADHLDVEDGRMCVQELLDLAWGDVLAAPDDHVLEPAYDLYVTPLIHLRQVACVHPTGGVDRFGGAFGVIPVAEHHRVAPCAQFACDTAFDSRAWTRDQRS